MIEVKINDAKLQHAAEAGMDEFVKAFVDAIREAIGGELTAETMAQLNSDQITLLAWDILHEEMMDGGMVQLIHNGYGAFLWKNPTDKAFKNWGLTELSKLIKKSHFLYKTNHEEIERDLTSADFSGILTKGGTILGSSRQPFKLMRVPDENGLDKVEAMKQNYYKLNLDCLVILGGNGTQKTANLLREEGLNVVHLPKTIDNDIYGTDVTFGFQSAINIACDAIDCIHTTAASHNRVFIVEVMGHKVGWLTLYAGMASGADIILLPEIPYDIDKVIQKIEDRDKKGCRFTIIAVAEGAISKEDAALTKKDYKKKMEKYPFPSVSYEVAAQIQEKTGREVRVTVPGHMQRGGSPCPYDRVFASRLGSEAGKLILDNQYGFMVGYKNREIVRVPLEDVAGKLKTVDPDATIVQEAKMLGICFGD